MTFTDDFNRADENLEDSADWTLVDGATGATKVASNVVKCDTTQSIGSYHCPDQGSADHYTQFIANDINSAFVCARLSDGSNFIGTRRLAPTASQIYKRASGSFTLIGNYSGSTSSGSTYKLTTDGNTIELLIGGISRVGPTTDSFNNTETRQGLAPRSSVITNWIDDFEVGVIGATGTLVEIPNKNLTLTSYAPSISISASVATEIPVHNLQLSSFAPSVNISDHKIVTIPNHDIVITSYAPSISIGDAIVAVIPTANITLSSFAPSVSIGDSIDIILPNKNIVLTSFAPSVFASDNKSLEISNHDISLVSFSPSVSVGDAIDINIPNSDILLSSFAPGVNVSVNISIDIPAHDLTLQSYPPSLVISSFVDLTIQNTDINLTSYAPLVTIAGAFSTAPERIYNVPAVNRNFVYPAINRIYTMPKK